MIYASDSPEYRIAEKTSELMGGGLRDEVLEFIDRSRSSGLCLHGIKNATRNLPMIKANGIENRTPEGGYVSFWAAGLQIFHTSSDLSFFGYDTPFFHYSMSSIDGSITRALAATTFKALHDADISYAPVTGSPDRQITVAEPVPVELITLYVGEHSSLAESSRDMFMRLYEAT